MGENIDDKNVNKTSGLEKGIRVRLLEDAANETVSKIASDIKPGLLATHLKIPKLIITGLHTDLVNNFKERAQKEVKNFLEENDCEIWKKLNELDRIEENTTTKPGYVAWRPSGNPTETMLAYEGAELKKHLAVLKDMQMKLEAETEVLIARVKEGRHILITATQRREEFLSNFKRNIEKNRGN